MLSIITSSYKSDYFSALEKNIAETCGLAHEIIKIDNIGTMGTCAAYNLGGKKARYDFLLFVHEDIKFITHNWGPRLMQHFLLDNLGAIGVAGGNYVPRAPSGWYTSESNGYINIIQYNNPSEKLVVKTFDEISKKVFALDGVFISMTKEKFLKFPFDEKLTGYHGYDTEISLRLAKKFTNYVISDIVIEHYSAGRPDINWFNANIYTRKKLGSNFQKERNNKVEFQMYNKFIDDYVSFYGVYIKDIIKLLAFFPHSLNQSEKKIFLKKFYYFLRYPKKYNVK